MKHWLDLTTEERKELQNEFNSKNSINKFCILFRMISILFYVLSSIVFVIIVGLILIKNNDIGYDDMYAAYFPIFMTLFIIFFIVAIINSIFISKQKKKFKEWLKVKNITK